MRMLIIKICKLVFSVLLLSLSACGKDAPIEPESWFAENTVAILEMTQLLLNHPAIERVDPGMDQNFIVGFDGFSTQDKLAYSRLEKHCELIYIKNIQSYSFIDSGDKTVIISFTLDSSGFVFSGGDRLVVSYITDTDFLDKINEIESVVKPLHLDDWYVRYNEWK